MRFFIGVFSYSVIILSFVGCKKESSLTKNNKDSVVSSVSNKVTKDSSVIKSSTTEVFSFQTELCDNKGYFNPQKYTVEQLEDTYKLCYHLGGVSFNTPSVFNVNSLSEVRKNKEKILAKLDKDFEEKKKLYNQLKIVDNTYWQKIKEQRYNALHQEYEKEKLQMAAYSDPSVLLNSKFSGKCKNFASALNSTDDVIISEWRKVREKASKSNADPERIMNDFETHLKEPNWKDYAIIDLITFGWGNCANAQIERPAQDEKMNKEFENLFIKIDSECDEP